MPVSSLLSPEDGLCCGWVLFEWIFELVDEDSAIGVDVLLAFSSCSDCRLSKCHSNGPMLIHNPPGFSALWTVAIYRIKFGAVSMKYTVVTASKVDV